MDGAKRILVFSDAGGTGRSYHADLAAKNQARRVHFLLEPGWRADAAIQGLGRTNRTNQARSEEHTSELQSLMRISYAVFCLKKKKKKQRTTRNTNHEYST